MVIPELPFRWRRHILFHHAHVGWCAWESWGAYRLYGEVRCKNVPVCRPFWPGSFHCPFQLLRTVIQVDAQSLLYDYVWYMPTPTVDCNCGDRQWRSLRLIHVCRWILEGLWEPRHLLYRRIARFLDWRHPGSQPQHLQRHPDWPIHVLTWVSLSYRKHPDCRMGEPRCWDAQD